MKSDQNLTEIEIKKVLDTNPRRLVDIIDRINEERIFEIIYTTPRNECVVMGAKMERGGVVKLTTSDVKTVVWDKTKGTLSTSIATTVGWRAVELIGYPYELQDAIQHLDSKGVKYDKIIHPRTLSWVVTLCESDCLGAYDQLVTFIRKVVNFRVTIRHSMEVLPSSSQFYGK